MREYSAVYILTNFNNTVLYTGVTSNLVQRINQHKLEIYPGFTKKYKVNKLVYFELFEDIRFAIAREKQIKAGSRKKKQELIHAKNPGWIDLCFDLTQ